MPDAYLHYWNVNVKGKLPHKLAFQKMNFRPIAVQATAGRVYTVVGIGTSPRRHFLWSTYAVVDGRGWHLSPPAILSEQDIAPIYSGRFSDELFLPIADDARLSRFAELAGKHHPPGNQEAIVKVLKAIEASLSHGRVATQIMNALKKVKLPPEPPPKLFVPSDPALPTEIRSLSIHQPWVELILRGIKDVENRDWGALSAIPAYRGWLAIHASKTADPYHEDDFPDCKLPKKLPTGCICGLAHLDDIVHIRDYNKACRKQKRKASEWACGEYCLLLSQPVRLPEPIPMAGRLGIFTLPEELQQELRRVL